MISQQQDPLTERDRLIISQIIKQVENHDIPTENIITLYVNDLGEVDGKAIKTVVVVTTHSLYSFGYEYFKQLTQDVRHKQLMETIKSASNSLVTRENVLMCQAIIGEVAHVEIPLDSIIGFQPYHIEVDGEWHRTVLVKTKSKLYSIDRNLFKRLRIKYREIIRNAAYSLRDHSS